MHVGWLSFPEGPIPVGVPLSKERRRGAGRSRTLSFSFGFTLLLRRVSHFTLLSPRALTF